MCDFRGFGCPNDTLLVEILGMGRRGGGVSVNDFRITMGIVSTDSTQPAESARGGWSNEDCLLSEADGIIKQREREEMHTSETDINDHCVERTLLVGRRPQP